MDPIPAQIVVTDVLRTGIQEYVFRHGGFSSAKRKEALYKIILSAKAANCPALAATACTLYETTQD